MHKQRIFMLLKTGAICIYRILDKETSVLEHMQYPNQIKDATGKAISQAITTMTIASAVPPTYDCELFTKPVDTKSMMGSFLLGKTFDTIHDSYLALGLSKGSVIFVSVNDLNTITARFSLHRQAVV
jgi:hypothetical protein